MRLPRDNDITGDHCHFTWYRWGDIGPCAALICAIIVFHASSRYIADACWTTLSNPSVAASQRSHDGLDALGKGRRTAGGCLWHSQGRALGVRVRTRNHLGGRRLVVAHLDAQLARWAMGSMVNELGERIGQCARGALS